MASIHDFFSSGGHYISYAKNCITNKWYEFNDAFVGEGMFQKLLSSESLTVYFVHEINLLFQFVFLSGSVE